MKSLKSVTPSPEQLTVIRRVRAGVELIRGAAGSGKTTTALIKLKLFLVWASSRRKREESTEPVRALVLTFNKTLRGYIEELVKSNAVDGDIDLQIDTFGRWAHSALNRPELCEADVLESFVYRGAAAVGLPADFLLGEIEYVLGRFLPDNLSDYVGCRRDGRGAVPRVEKVVRQSILDNIIYPYEAWKEQRGLLDWNDLAVMLSRKKIFDYDVVIVDESQDFSANFFRAILKQLSPEGAASFIIDTAQRIYARGFSWSEIGLAIRPENSHRLTTNYRNPPAIARLAAHLLDNVVLDDDGTTPELFFSEEDSKPFLLKGIYREQVSWCINFIKNNVDLSEESVAFLHPKGGGWFDFLKIKLCQAEIDCVDVSRKSEWPRGVVNVALTTLHSAKGLDFDHVFIIGIQRDGFPVGNFEKGDDRLENTYRLLAMAIARARKTVVLGYKEGEQPTALASMSAEYFTEVQL